MRFLALPLGVSLAALGACGAQPRGAGLVLPVEIAEGSGNGAPPPDAGAPPPEAAKASKPARSGADATPAGVLPLESAPPDPEALRTAEQIEYQLVYENGAARVGSVRRVRFTRPIVTPRKMGRFAVELWIGRELVERVRFDFPLLAADEPLAEGERRALHEPPPLTKGPITAKVMVPYSERARRAFLVDRATGKLTELAWPPGS